MHEGPVWAENDAPCGNHQVRGRNRDAPVRIQIDQFPRIVSPP